MMQQLVEQDGIKTIYGPSGEINQASPPQSVTVLLEDDIDISRGDMLVRPNNQPMVIQDIDLMICWFDGQKALNPMGKYSIKHT